MSTPTRGRQLMPPKGYRHLSIREDIYRRLEEFAYSKGLTYPADAIPILLEYADIYSKLEYLLQVRVKDLLQTGVTLPQTGVNQTKASSPTQQASEQKGKQKTAWDILREQEIVCASTMKSARDPERIIGSLKGKGAIILVSENDKCAVYPDTWMSIIESLAKISSPDEREVLGKLKGKAKQLFKMLRAVGAVHFDSKTKTWIVDTSVIEKGEESLGLEEVKEEKAESEYVMRISKDDVGDVESYIADTEREGWMCNEKAGSIICVWREFLEQVVVDLNNSKTGVNDLEKALVMDKDKLEVGKAAYEAGVLWFDSKEKRWRIVS